MHAPVIKSDFSRCPKDRKVWCYAEGFGEFPLRMWWGGKGWLIETEDGPVTIEPLCWW